MRTPPKPDRKPESIEEKTDRLLPQQFFFFNDIENFDYLRFTPCSLPSFLSFSLAVAGTMILLPALGWASPEARHIIRVTTVPAQHLGKLTGFL